MGHIKKTLQSMEVPLKPSPTSEIVKHKPLGVQYQDPIKLSNRVVSIVAFEDLMACKFVSIRSLVKLHGELAIKEAITVILAYAEDMMGFDKRMSTNEIVECVHSIFYQYAYLSLEELCWVLRRVWEGKEDEAFGRLKIAVITRALAVNKQRRISHFNNYQ